MANPLALPSDIRLRHNGCGEERDEPLGQDRPPVQPAVQANRLRSLAIFKWVGLIFAWMIANIIVTSVHLDLLVFATTGALIWYGVHSTRRGRRQLTRQQTYQSAFEFPPDARCQVLLRQDTGVAKCTPSRHACPDHDRRGHGKGFHSVASR